MKRIGRIAIGSGLCVMLATCVLAQDGEHFERGKGQGRQGGRDGKAMMRGGQQAMMGGMLARLLMNPRAAEELDLSEDQSEALHKGFKESRMALIDIRAEMEKAAIEQAELLMADTIDEKALMEAVEKTGDLRTEMAKLTMRQFLLVKKTLTPEQIQKAKKLGMKKMKQRQKRQKGKGERDEGQGRRGGRAGRDHDDD